VANIESFVNEVKTEQDAVQERAATRAKFKPASLVRAGHGIPVHLGHATIQLLTLPREDSYWVMKASLHPGESVPLHSHSDAEDFYLLSGEAEALVQAKHGLEWQTIKMGDFIHIPGDMKHAWRNRHSGPAEQIIVTSPRLGRFLHELGKLLRVGGNNGTMEKLQHLTERYGYWLGSPEENAELGISLP
jgi:quercetin dioxygenase-like cupin family protein